MFQKILSLIFPQRGVPDLDKFEVYNIYYNEAEAFIAKGILETSGIKCFLEGETLSSVYPQLPFTGIRLLMRQGDFLIADHILSQNMRNDEKD